MSLSDHTDTNQDDHNVAKRIIARELSNRHGKDSAISSHRLAELTPVSQSTVRDLVPEVRTQFNMPIASGSTGYFVIANRDEFIEVMDRIEDTIATKKERQSELAAAFNSRVIE